MDNSCFSLLPEQLHSPPFIYFFLRRHHYRWVQQIDQAAQQEHTVAQTGRTLQETGSKWTEANWDWERLTDLDMSEAWHSLWSFLDGALGFNQKDCFPPYSLKWYFNNTSSLKSICFPASLYVPISFKTQFILSVEWSKTFSALAHKRGILLISMPFVNLMSCSIHSQSWCPWRNTVCRCLFVDSIPSLSKTNMYCVPKRNLNCTRSTLSVVSSLELNSILPRLEDLYPFKQRVVLLCLNLSSMWPRCLSIRIIWGGFGTGCLPSVKPRKHERLSDYETHLIRIKGAVTKFEPWSTHVYRTANAYTHVWISFARMTHLKFSNCVSPPHFHFQHVAHRIFGAAAVMNPTGRGMTDHRTVTLSSPNADWQAIWLLLTHTCTHVHGHKKVTKHWSCCRPETLHPFSFGHVTENDLGQRFCSLCWLNA